MDRIGESMDFIVKALKNNPDHAYITHDRKMLIMLLPDGRVMALPGDYENLSDDVINLRIQRILEKLTK